MRDLSAKLIQRIAWLLAVAVPQISPEQMVESKPPVSDSGRVNVDKSSQRPSEQRP